MTKIRFSFLLLLVILIYVDGRKLSKSRSSSSSRGSSKHLSSSHTNSQQQQQSASKTSLFGWQESSAQRTQAKAKPAQTHSYPPSQTGLSGSSPAKQPGTHQENIQRSNSGGLSQNVPQNKNQPGHSYPASTGLSGSSGTGASYPQGTGLSGSGASYPHQGNQGLSGAGAPPAYSAGNHPTNLGTHHSQGHPPSYPGNSGMGVGYPKQPPPYSPGNYHNNYGGNHHQGPPPPYSGGYGHSSYNPVQTPQMPGYFGNYGNHGGSFGGVSRSRNILTGVGIAGAGVGTVLTGLALWNLARSTGHRQHTVIYDNRGQPVAVAPNNSTEPVADNILADLVNCSLTIANDNATEVLAIPCAIATSFTPEADIKDSSVKNEESESTKCTVTVTTKAGREFMTKIPCSILLQTAAENNVTEPALAADAENVNGTAVIPDQTNADYPLNLSQSAENQNNHENCTAEQGNENPKGPCYAISGNSTVIPLISSTVNPVNDSIVLITPSSA